MKAFFELLNQSSLSLQHPEEGKPVTPAELCPILKMLYRILITRYPYFLWLISFEPLLLLVYALMLLGRSHVRQFLKRWGMRQWMTHVNSSRLLTAISSSNHLFLVRHLETCEHFSLFVSFSGRLWCRLVCNLEDWYIVVSCVLF